MTHEFTKKMKEISGFGGGYEESCRKMILAGVEWLESNPESSPKFSTLKDVFGIVCDENDDAKELENVIVSSVPDCTGAMVQAVIGHLMFIKDNGWDRYVEEMEKEN